MVFSLFEYLDSVNCNHREYVQLWQIFDKKRYNFGSNRNRKKKRYLFGMKFCCVSNAAIKKMSKSHEKNYFQQNRHFLKKIQIFRKHKVYFQIMEVLSVILTTYLPV